MAISTHCFSTGAEGWYLSRPSVASLLSCPHLSCLIVVIVLTGVTVNHLLTVSPVIKLASTGLGSLVRSGLSGLEANQGPICRTESGLPNKEFSFYQQQKKPLNNICKCIDCVFFQWGRRSRSHFKNFNQIIKPVVTFCFVWTQKQTQTLGAD